MPALLRVNGRDLSNFMRLAHDEGLDPHNVEAEPQFGGSPASGEGRAFVGETVENRTRVFPLIVSGQSPDEVEQIKRDIQAELQPGAQVEFRVEGASQSTFFTVEAGKLEPLFQYWISRASHQRCDLRLWTRPYGTSGSQRAVASLPAGSQAVVSFPVTGVLGDVDALANLEVRVGSRVASAGRVVGFGVHRSASYAPIFSLPNARSEAQPSSVVRGASGALGSQILAIPISPTGASGVAVRSYLTPPDAFQGRHRVFAIGRSGLDQPITLWARDRFGAPLGPTTAASQTAAGKRGLIDLGEINVPSRVAGMEPTPTQFLELIAGGASGAVVGASPALELDALFLLPLDFSPGLMRTRGAGGQQVAGDTFARLGNTLLSNMPEADEGGRWSKLYGEFAGFRRGITSTYPTGAYGDAGASPVLATLGPRADLTDLQIRAEFQLAGSLAAGPSSRIELRKTVGTGFLYDDGVYARFLPGPSQTLQIVRTENFTSSVVASAGISVARASGIYLGQPHQLVMEVSGPTVSVYIGTAPASPALVAGVELAALQGRVDLGLQNASAGATRAVMVRSIRAYELGASAVDAAAREVFRFESDPRPRAIQGNASVYVADRTAEYRGDNPRVPAVGSAGPSGPAQMIVFSGDVDDFVGGDALDVRVRVLERFRWLR